MATRRPGGSIPGSLFISDSRDDLHRAFKHLTRDFTSSTPFTRASLSESSEGPAGPTSQGWMFKIDVSESMRELISSVELRASAQAALWGGTVSGAASWVNDVEFREETLVVVVTARNVLDVSPYDGTKLRMVDEAKALMDAGDERSFTKFYDKYGSYFVGKRWRGGELNVVLRRDFASRRDKEQAAATVRASGMAWSANAEAAQEKAGALDQLSLSVEGYGVGGSLNNIPSGGRQTS